MPRERSDFSVGGAIAAGLALAALVALVLITVHAITLRGRATSPDEAPLPALSPVGEAEFESGSQLAAFRAAEVERLHEWRWEDGGKKFAQIPVERVIELEGAAR